MKTITNYDLKIRDGKDFNKNRMFQEQIILYC